MVRAGLLCGAIGAFIILLLNLPAHAQSASSWIDSPIVKISEAPLQRSFEGGTTCSGTMTRIEIHDIPTSQTACVYGEGNKTRLARYIDFAGVFRYVVAFSADTKYREIRNLCVDEAGCIYSQAEDSAIIQEMTASGITTGRIITNFSKHLAKVHENSASYFVLESGVGEAIADQNGLLRTRSIALSGNQQWAILEIFGKGLMRINLKTGTLHWIAMLSTAGTAPEDLLNLAISNDGRWVVVTGWYHGIEMYEANENCGYSGKLQPQQVSWCLSTDIALSDMVQGFVFGYNPQFSDDGTRLSLSIESEEGLRRILLSSEEYSATTNPQYHAFGDSFASGEGELSDEFYLPGTNTADNHCHVSKRSYSYLLAASWEVVASNHACSGSRIPDVRAKSSTVLSSDHTPATVISIGVGGNDVDFMGKLKSCLGPGTCEWALEGNRAATANEMKRLLPELISLINDMHRNATVPLFLVGYPLVINPASDASCDMVVSALLNKQERDYMDASIRLLNNVLESAAQFTDTTYVDIESALVGERLCDPVATSMNGVRMGDDIAPIAVLQNSKFIGAESFHPTPRGHERIAQAIENQLRTFWMSPTCHDCQADSAPPDYWFEGATLAQQLTTQFNQNFIQATTIRENEVIAFSFPSETFSPGSVVSLEIHSDVQTLGEYKANQDGSLQGTFTIPNEMVGYHTVHARGVSYADESLDIYQIIYVKPNAHISTTTTTTATAILHRALGDEKSSGQNTVQATTEVLGVNNLQTPLASPLLQTEKSKQPPRPNRMAIEFYIYLGIAAIALLIIGTFLLRRKV